jgi:uncharacterized protein (DUF1501 family)
MRNTDDRPTFKVSRRRFLAGAGAAVTLAACAGSGIDVYRRAATTTSAYLTPGTAPSPTSTIPTGTVPVTDRTLVVVEMGGGNDSLSTVVPASGRYRDLRTTTAIEHPIGIDDDIGLHPALTTIAERYRAGDVAIVEGLGMPDPDLSHFVSMRRWWDGTDRPDHTGWLGRYLDASVGYEQILAGISVGPNPSPAMLGSGSFVVGVSSPDGLASGFPWWVDDVRDFAGVWSGFAPAGVPVAELDPVRRAIANTADAQRTLQRSISPLQNLLDGSSLEWESLEGRLALAAGLIVSDVDPRVIYVHGNTDFDTHEDQLDVHGTLMEQLDRGIAGFFEIIDAAGASDRVLLMTTSEFGRRPRDNDGGTDHGTAGSHFVIGSRVAGGRYGETPSLRRLDPDGNLIHTVDFRSLYATVLERWLEASPDDILRGSYETLPFVEA